MRGDGCIQLLFNKFLKIVHTHTAQHRNSEDLWKQMQMGGQQPLVST